MAYKIAALHGREVLDSRGNPTVEVELELSDGYKGRAIVPSGASTGEHEVLELRDGDNNRFLGKGTLKAVANINEQLSRQVIGQSFEGLVPLDRWLIEQDGTPQKKHIGANAILGISMAFAHAVANSQKRPLYKTINEAMGLSEKDLRLPVPLMNVVNGGEHANNGLEIQEFMIVPHGFESFSEALRAGCEIFQHMKKRLHAKGFSTAVGDEGGFAPNLETNDQALEVICEAIEKAGYKLKTQVSLALDVAASSFYSAGKGLYHFSYEKENTIPKEALMGYYETLIEKFPIVSMEDGLDENDWDGWKTLTERFGKRLQLVGDDLFVTNKSFVQKGIDQKVGNAVLIKVNQIGTLAETFDTMHLCRENSYHTVTSHRSGETEDVTIAHLAVGSGSSQIKTGSLSRSERTAKYNELLRIEENARRAGNPIPFAKRFG